MIKQFTIWHKINSTKLVHDKWGILDHKIIYQLWPYHFKYKENNSNKIFIDSSFQLFYGVGFYGGTGPYINIGNGNTGISPNGIPWPAQTSLNVTNTFDTAVPLNPYLGMRMNKFPFEI